MWSPRNLNLFLNRVRKALLSIVSFSFAGKEQILILPLSLLFLPFAVYLFAIFSRPFIKRGFFFSFCSLSSQSFYGWNGKSEIKTFLLASLLRKIFKISSFCDRRHKISKGKWVRNTKNSLPFHFSHPCLSQISNLHFVNYFKCLKKDKKLESFSASCPFESRFF